MSASSIPARYRSIATRLAYRRPVLSAIIAQVNFWVLTNTVLNGVVWTVLRATHVTYPDVQPPPFLGSFAVGITAGILYGTLLGLVDAWMDRRVRLRASLGTRIIVQGLLYTVIFAVISTLTVSG